MEVSFSVDKAVYNESAILELVDENSNTLTLQGKQLNHDNTNNQTETSNQPMGEVKISPDKFLIPPS